MSEVARPLLEVTGLDGDFDGRAAVRGVDFMLERGEVLGLVGESGPGESATALAVLGLLPGERGGAGVGTARRAGAGRRPGNGS